MTNHDRAKQNIDEFRLKFGLEMSFYASEIIWLRERFEQVMDDAEARGASAVRAQHNPSDTADLFLGVMHGASSL